MPDRAAKTVRDVIYNQYAKIIACSVFKCKNAKEAKKYHYGFIKNTLRSLMSGDKKWSSIEREDWQFRYSDEECIYCGSKENLQKEHIVPKSIKIKPECSTCERILSIHNQVLACKACNLLKSKKGLYQFFKDSHPEEKQFFDIIPPLLEKKYLKTIFYCHQCAGTLDACDLNNDGMLSVLDIDSVLKINNCI
jgi:HNH endonuclease